MSSEWREKERERERVGSKNKKERIHGSTKYMSRVDKEKKEVYIQIFTLRGLRYKGA